MSNLLPRTHPGGALRCARLQQAHHVRASGIQSRRQASTLITKHVNDTIANARLCHRNPPPPTTAAAAGWSWTRSLHRGRKTAELTCEQIQEDRDLDPLWLRDICSCEHCVDASSGQKKFWTVDIPHDIKVKTSKVTEDGAVEYSWENDLPAMPQGHVTKLYPNQIKEALAGPESLLLANKKAWTADELNLFELDYNDYFNDPAAFRQALLALHQDGLIFVKNVPESEQSVVDIAEKIGPLKNTFYGMTWDVKSVPKAKNVAYTSGHLGFHQDLLYMYDPPRLQFLHCLRSSAAGGASLFSDGFRACMDLYRSDKDVFRDLCEVKTNFHYNKDGKHYTQSRTLIEYSEPSTCNVNGKPMSSSADEDVLASIQAINWSPPFQGPFTQRELESTDKIKRWHNAARKFRDRTEAHDNVLERLMKPGDCVVFDNQRILHARTAFAPGDAGKERWLKGCYVDADPFWSSLRKQHAVV